MTDAAAQESRLTGTEIAIVGVSGRFPGARDLDAFWKNLLGGVEALVPLDDKRLAAEGVRPRDLEAPEYVKTAFVMEDWARFDAALFDITPQQALTMDPQQRQFMECCWAALEHAGYAPRDTEVPVGVYGGTSINSYFLFNLWPKLLRDPSTGFASFYPALLDAAPERLTTRVSYKLNLRGPSFSVSAACSTALVAVHLACQSLLTQECDIALAGGAGFGSSGHLHMREGPFSSNGRCRPFDRSADGTAGGSGVGVVVLKRLADALAGGDTIHAVILGSALNNDGDDKIGYTAPSVEGQRRVIAAALGAAGVTADTIGYVETHGTATLLGDPIEIEALRRAYGARAKGQRSCALGAVKANVGHLGAAAGIAGFVKAVLALRNRVIPPHPNFGSLNPEISLDNGPFYIPCEPVPWASDGPRRAAVTALGIGGTNAHMILEEAPPPVRAFEDVAERPWQVLCLSARTPTALERATAELREHLAAHGELDLADVAFTLQRGRSRLRHRRALVCRRGERSFPELGDPERAFTFAVADVVRPVLFFPGATEIPRGALSSLSGERAYAEEIARCRAALASRGHVDLDLDAPVRGADAGSPARAFAAQAATARLLLDLGLRAEGLFGRDLLGDAVAAYLAGVLDLQTALGLVLDPDPARIRRALTEGALRPGTLPILDRRGHRVVPAEQVTQAEYWAERLTRAPSPLELELDDRLDLVVELGRGSLGASPEGGARPTRYVRTASDALPDEQAGFVAALGHLWTLGVEIDWSSYHRGRARRRVPLPTYPFEGQHYFQPADEPPPQREPPSWLSARAFRRVAFGPAQAEVGHGPWLLCADEGGLGNALASLLRASGANVTIIAEREASDAGRALAALGRALDLVDPRHVVYLWSLASSEEARVRAEILWSLSGMLAERGGGAPRSILVVTTQALDVSGVEPPPRTWLGEAPGVVAGASRGVRCRVLDVDVIGPEAAARLLAEALDEADHETVAWRGPHRWLPALDPLVAREPARRGALDVAVAGCRTGEDVSVAAAIGDALPSGSTLELIGPYPLPAPERWQHFVRTPPEALVTEPEVRNLVGKSPLLGVDFGAFGAGLEADAARLHEEQERFADGEGFVADSEALCARWALDHFRRQGIDTRAGARHNVAAFRAGVVPEFHKFIAFLVELLRAAGLVAIDGETVTFREHALPDAEAMGAAFLARRPEFRAWYELCRRCVDAYPDVFRGALHPHQVIYPGGSHELLRDMERRTPDITNRRACHETFLRAIERIAAATDAPLTILEVGAGTGLVTWDVLARLAGRPVSYIFTDIGRSFVAEAAREATRRKLDNVRFAPFDISKDPAPQGFALNSADLVLAFNVVQATQNVVTTLGHLGDLLAPGGALVMMNTVRNVGWQSIVFGLAKGWWAFEDEAFRRHTPVLDVAAWERAMGAAGFEDVRAFPRDAKEHRGVILGRRKRAQPRPDLAASMRAAVTRLSALEQRGVRLASGERTGNADRAFVWLEDSETETFQDPSYGRLAQAVERRVAERRRAAEQAAAFGAGLRVRVLRGRDVGPAERAARAAEVAREWTTVEWSAPPLADVTALFRHVLPPASLLGHVTVNDVATPALRPSAAATTMATSSEEPGASDVASSPPRLDLAIARLWQEVLGVPSIATDANFFEVGGDSLAALQLQTRIKEVFGVDVGIGELMEAETTGDMARLVERLRGDATREVIDDAIPVIEPQAGDVQALVEDLHALSDDEVAAFIAERAKPRG